MSTRNITLKWDDSNLIEKGYKVYRSKTPMDTHDMPMPIGELEPNSTEFIDIDQPIGDTNYYRVSAWIDGHEMYSSELVQEVYEELFVYTGQHGGHLVKYTEHGEHVWSKQQLHSDSISSIDLDLDGMVYTGSNDKTCKKVSPEGDVLWTYNGPNAITVSVDINNSVIYVGHDTLVKMSYDGDVLWSSGGFANRIVKIFTDSNGYIYTTSYDTTVRKFDALGNEVWRVNDSTTTMDVCTDSFNNVIYINYQGKIVKMDSDANLIWTETPSSYGTSLRSDDEGNIYAGLSGTNAGAIKLSPSGEEIWHYPTSSGIVNIRMFNNHVYLACSDGYVYKLVASDGSLIWKSPDYLSNLRSIGISRFLN